MKFLLFTYRDPSVQLTPEQRATVPAAVGEWCDEMDTRGVRLTVMFSPHFPRRARFAFEKETSASTTAL